ncbi:MAG: alpha/beta fold hydrolase [Sphingomonadales bacterium]|nr:alpha/beta fold hydrolase [Sphingomonadales bacterium]MBD3774698.1 alpha/beta fold hydrolase [Paracoccaceae bacterium]
MAQATGELVSADPVVDTPPGMQAWRVRYWTRSDSNRPIEVTGMIVAPREAAPRDARKIVAWAHGTSGVAQDCAVSTSPDFWQVTPGLSEMIAAGYVVVAPDYPGLGSDMQHGYLIGREAAHSVIDAVRAAQQIPGAYAGKDFAVWGESQGGHAALWTASEARRYGKGLNLVGTAAVAPPTDLLENLRTAKDQNVRAMLTAFVTYSWSQRFGAPLADLFGSVNRGVVGRLARNNCIKLDASPKLGTIVGILSVRNELKKADLAAHPAWASIARRNSTSAASVRGPVYMAQSVDDPLVSSDVTAAFARQLCRRGRAVQYESLPGGDHAKSGANSAGSALAWIANRFAGKPVPSTCRQLLATR